MLTFSLVVAALLAQSGEAPPVLTLEQALREARRNNLDIQQAEARLYQADQAAAKAWSYYLPQITAQGIYTYNEPAVALPAGFIPGFPEVVITPRNQLNALAQARQALIAPALWPTIAAAHTGERVAGLNVENARREVLFGVARTYYGAASLRQLVTVQERTLSLAREREKDARVRYQAGSTPKVAFLRAEIDRAQSEQDLKRAQNDYASARLALGTLLVRSGDFEVEIPASPKALEGDLEATALRERPDVLAARSGVDLARQQRSAAWLKYAPSVGAFGQVLWSNFTGFSGHETTWAAGVSVSWNLLDGGLREAEIREASGKVAESEAGSRAAELRAVEEVRRARLDLESALANRSKAEERVQLARENARLVEVAFRAGAATYLEATDAAESLRQAEISLVAESLAADLAKLQLQKAVGGFGEVPR
jgi:outer membrane protein TolC